MMEGFAYYLGYGVLLLVLGLWFWDRISGAGLDTREPPLVRSRVPVVGHLLGMLRWQIEYFEMLSARYSSYPCFTLKVLGGRIYILSSPSLVQQAMRHKTLSFEPFIVQTTARMFALSPSAKKILEHTAPSNEPTYMTEIHHSMYTPLGIGPALYEMNARALESLGGFLNEIGPETQRRELYTWIRDTFTEASAQALYGPQNPITEDRTLIDSLWDFETDLNWLLLGIFPQITAPKAYKGRAQLQKGFAKYYNGGHERSAAGLIKERNKTGRKWGFSEQDIADFEVSMIFVSTTNTVPSGFWLICYIFSDPQLLQSIRDEVETIVSRRRDKDGVERIYMDISLFERKTPLLVSAYREAFRLINAGVSVRSVLEDTLLDNRYLLKKGSVVQMPSGPLHTSSEIWGADADHFDAYRFLSTRKEDLSKEERKKQTQGYFPFGGGRHLCPGRHFAFTEIVGMVATLVYGFEITGEGAALRIPAMGEKKIGTAVRKPAAEVPVLIRRREGLEGVRWAYEFGSVEKDG